MTPLVTFGIAERHAVGVLWSGCVSQRHHGLDPRQFAILLLNGHLLLGLIVQGLIVLLLLFGGSHPLGLSFFTLFILVGLPLPVTLFSGCLFGVGLTLSEHLGGFDVVGLGLVLDLHVA